MRGKTLWAGEWMWVRPRLNKHFRTDGKCSICSSMSCAPGWFSANSAEFRCAKCFDAEELHGHHLDVLEGFEASLRGDGITPEGRRRQRCRASR